MRPRGLHVLTPHAVGRSPDRGSPMPPWSCACLTRAPGLPQVADGRAADRTRWLRWRPCVLAVDL